MNYNRAQRSRYVSRTNSPSNDISEQIESISKTLDSSVAGERQRGRVLRVSAWRGVAQCLRRGKQTPHLSPYLKSTQATLSQHSHIHRLIAKGVDFFLNTTSAKNIFFLSANSHTRRNSS